MVLALDRVLVQVLDLVKDKAQVTAMVIAEDSVSDLVQVMDQELKRTEDYRLRPASTYYQSISVVGFIG